MNVGTRGRAEPTSTASTPEADSSATTFRVRPITSQSKATKNDAEEE